MSVDIPAKPRVLIADDSKIVRATLIKHIQGMFEFREALNGEEAWETLLIDPNIRVVITDLSMPKLDGYGLLTRIRTSEINRIRSLPVVVVSGSDEQAERDRAKAAGATDLITKGIGTAQLLSRLDILSKLVNTQREFEHSLEVLARNAVSQDVETLPTPTALEAHAEKMLDNALRRQKNFVMLNVLVGLKHASLAGQAATPPISVVNAVGQLLHRTIRQTDRVAKTGEAEFTLATGSIHFDSARNFAQRICRAIANANMVKDDQMSFVACCGVASLSEHSPDSFAEPTILGMKETAHRRALIGLNLAATGVVGPEEEAAFIQNGTVEIGIEVEAPAAPQSAPAAPAATPASSISFQAPAEAAPAPVELATLVQWIREGKQDKVMEHMKNLSTELQPLAELILQQANAKVD
jgi:two-component system cell cycle response regulator